MGEGVEGVWLYVCYLVVVFIILLARYYSQCSGNNEISMWCYVIYSFLLDKTIAITWRHIKYYCAIAGLLHYVKGKLSKIEKHHDSCMQVYVLAQWCLLSG